MVQQQVAVFSKDVWINQLYTTCPAPPHVNNMTDKHIATIAVKKVPLLASSKARILSGRVILNTES